MNTQTITTVNPMKLKLRLVKGSKSKSKGVADAAPKVYDLSSIDDTFLRNVMECFLNTNETKRRFQNYFIDGNTLFYRTTDNRLHVPKMIEHVVATKIAQDSGVLILGNSSVLAHIDKKASHKLNKGQTRIQGYLARLIPMMPMSVFEQARLDVNILRIVEQGKEELIRVREVNPAYTKWHNKPYGEARGEAPPQFRYIKRHYTGCTLFSIGKEYFLFDIDRREIEHGIFNAFLVNLPGKVSSIAEGYESLKPSEVKKALKQGLEVLRQGEWFFIPVDKATATMLDGMSLKPHAGDRDKSLDYVTLQAGTNRPNNAFGVRIKNGKRVSGRDSKAGVLYVTDTVSHSGREHKDLKLKGWYIPVPNTAQKSFTITGDVD